MCSGKRKAEVLDEGRLCFDRTNIIESTVAETTGLRGNIRLNVLRHQIIRTYLRATLVTICVRLARCSFAHLIIQQLRLVSGC
jgi:hypothetical protein